MSSQVIATQVCRLRQSPFSFSAGASPGRGHSAHNGIDRRLTDVHGDVINDIVTT